jgi:hypothetical protein
VRCFPEEHGPEERGQALGSSWVQGRSATLRLSLVRRETILLD